MSAFACSGGKFGIAGKKTLPRNTAGRVRWPRFVRQVLRFLRWSPAPWLNGLSADSARGDDGLYQIFLVT